MSERDDEQGGYPIGDSHWRRDGNADDPSNRAPDASALDASALEAPVDLAAVQADEALLNMLGSGADPALDGTDAELARILVSWRREVDSEPFGELVDAATATTVLSTARRPASRRHPVLGPFAAAAAVLVIAFSGVGLVAKSAEPGDQLWSLTKVLYTDYARSVEAAEQVKAELAEADTALKQGDTLQAKEALQRIEEQLPAVNEDQDRTELATQYQQMESRLQQSGGAEVEDEAPVTTSEPSAAPSSPTPVAPVPPDTAVSPDSSTSPTTPSPVPTTSSEPPSPSPAPVDPEPRSSAPAAEASPASSGTTSDDTASDDTASDDTASDDTASDDTASDDTATSQPAG